VSVFEVIFAIGWMFELFNSKEKKTMIQEASFPQMKQGFLNFQECVDLSGCCFLTRFAEFSFAKTI